MGDIRTSSMGGVPFGTSDSRPSNPQIGQTYYNGTLGVQEIYTSSGWLPATGANDFNVTLNGPVTTATFTKEYFAGAYTIASALLDSSYDIYVYDTAGNQVGYTKSPSLAATGNFNKIVVVGGSTGDLLSFSYKTTFTANSTTSQVTAGAFITSVTPTALNSINDTTTVAGGNFASDVAVYFMGSDNIEVPAKSIVRSSNSQLIVTRPDNFPTNLGTYKVIVENPGITRPTGSSLHILNNAITPGTTPNWTIAAQLTDATPGVAYSATLAASDVEGTQISYSLISGSIPSGLSMNYSTGVLSGTPNSGAYSFTLRATDTGGNTVDRQFLLNCFFASPTAAQTAGVSAGSYLFKGSGMTTYQTLYFEPSYYDSSPFVRVFSAPNGSTATLNKIDLDIPMNKLLVQRNTLDVRGVARFSSTEKFNTIGGSGIATSSVSNNFGGQTSSMKVFLGYAGGHGIFNPSQSTCNWGSNISGAIGAGYDGTGCGTFPNDLRFGYASSNNGPTYSGPGGTWEYWVTW